MWALERLDDCTKQEGLGPQYTRMKASCAGVEALASAVWLLWMARYTEYSMIFPDVTEGGSQVRWAPSELCRRTMNKYYSVPESMNSCCCYRVLHNCMSHTQLNKKDTGKRLYWCVYLADFDGARGPWEAW